MIITGWDAIMQGYRLQTCVLKANHVVPPRRNKAANRLRKKKFTLQHTV